MSESKRMHILFVTDALTPPARGNGTTVARWIEGLARRGHRVSVITPEQADVEATDVDLVLAYHAERAGPTGAIVAARASTPLLLALGGTDILAIETGRSPNAVSAVERARVVVGAFADSSTRVAPRLSTQPHYRVVRRGVFVDEDIALDRDAATLHIALPSGIRAVKNPMLALDMLAHLRRHSLRATLEILGTALDAELAQQLAERATAMGGVRIGSRPPVAMGAAYCRAHVVWNTSDHEGGANAVLEAMSLGCAAWLRDVPGNRELAAEPDSPVRLFRAVDEPQFVEFHRKLLSLSSADRAQQFRRTVTWLRRCHDPSDEIEDLEAACRLALEA
jgi:glycosyltransferase involved in cell wall biosynthesis